MFNSKFFLLSLPAVGGILAISIFLKRKNYSNSTAVNENDVFTVKNIVYDEKFLKKPCRPVENVNDTIRANLQKMRRTMYLNKGIGIAANQVGLSHRMIVIDLQENGVKKPMYLINPKVVWNSSETKTYEEGCLSVPVAVKSKITRSARIRVEYLDINGVKRDTGKVGGLLAVCLQHEIDHLNGKLYIDYLPKNEKSDIVEKASSILKKLKASTNTREKP
jgi:peptide deformylase